LAIAAPAFGSDIVGLHTIQAGYSGLVGTTYTNDDARLAPNSGDTTTIVITDGYTFSSGGETRFGEKGAAATITVEVGGILNMDSEMIWNEDGQSTQSNRLNVYGTAYVAQLKQSGEAGDDITTVGNGTDAATLTIVEGFLGKKGNASITVSDGSTMIITGGNADSFKIDGNALGTNTGAYIDLVGSGTLKVSTFITASFINQSIQGDGTLGNWDVNAGTGDDAAYNIYTATAVPEPTSMSLLALGGLALLRRRRRA
jgi:hypothetical protein